jgi:N-methylhydantoinase B
MSVPAAANVQELVMWNRLQAVADEQAEALMRTAFSPIVRESGDVSAGVFDVHGRMLAQAVTGTPGHVNTMAAAVANFFDFFPRQAMRPGDVYLTNDPWIGAGHLNDFVLVQPCFVAGKLIGFLSCTSHLVDIGGQCMGPDGTDVYDEGLYIPPLRLLDRGQLNETLIALLKANSRIPEESEGDVHALIACCNVGEQRLRQMFADFDIDNLEDLSRTILSTSEQATRARIAELPDGVYRNEMLTDGHDFEIRLKAALYVDADQLRLNLAGSSGLSRHGINVPLNYAKAYALFGIKCVVAPDIPNNAGALAPMDVTAPPGSIVNARKPSPVCSRHIVGQLLPDLALGCLHQAVPDRVPAEGAATLWDLPLRNAVARGNGDNPRSFSVELVHNGGTGARPGKDGLSATAYPSGVMGSMVEITENVAPLLVQRRELRVDSGGAGRTRGGLGQVIEIQSSENAPILLFGTVDRIKHPARGREHGGAGANGVLKLASGTVLQGKGRQEIPGGETLVVLTPGGGGYGAATERDPRAVACDVADGLVTREAAARDYGVVLCGDGTADLSATERMRGAMADACVADTAAAVPEYRPQFAGNSRGGGRIGVVLPMSNTNLEPDMMLLRPEGVSLHFMRVGGYDLDAVPDSAQMRKLALASLDEVIDTLKAALPDVILYGCTSATLALGPEFDRKLQHQIEELSGAAVVTAAGAVIEALSDLGVRKIGFCSPYVRKLNEEAVNFLGECGFEVASEAHVDTDLGNYGQGALTPHEVFELAMRADHPQAEALVLSCTDMRAVETITTLEAALGKPVVTSNQALMHAARKRLGISKPGCLNGGRLLSAVMKGVAEIAGGSFQAGSISTTIP